MIQTNFSESVTQSHPLTTPLALDSRGGILSRTPTTNYNPDVLSCLANLSNDEVFTPPALVNNMLDLLPAELWSNPEARFLDPVSKSGVFLREMAKRLMVGLEPIFPDQQERINHIFKNQLFGIAITELTSLLSRRSVYCSKIANHSKYSLCTEFDDEQGNIRYERMVHTFQNGKCKFCGASQAEYDRSDASETYAYNFIHLNNPLSIFKLQNMKFDVVAGNPPYQLSDGSGGSNDAAIPIYNKFIDQAISLNPKYLIMIIPSKWMVGGRGLKGFRDKMMADTRIRYLVDFENSSDCFYGLHIDGGVCYFLWDKEYNGKIEYTFNSNNKTQIKTKQFLKNDYFEYVIRDSRILSIIEKISNGDRFSKIVSQTKPFGIRKFLFNEPERYPDSNLKFNYFDGSVRIYGVKGIKGGAKRMIGYISKNIISNNIESINKYKLFFTTSYSSNAINPPEIIIGEPGDICTETFLQIGHFENEIEQKSCLSYMETSFFKVLLYFGKGTMQVTRSVFGLIPLQDFSEPWTDEKLYKKYGLTAEEIAFIESMIRPMEL